MIDIELDYKTVIATALVGAAAVWISTRTLKKAGAAIGNAVKDAAIEVEKAVNPTKETNLVNRAANWAWQKISGSEDQIGEDIYDGVQHVKSLYDHLAGLVDYDDAVMNSEAGALY